MTPMTNTTAPDPPRTPPAPRRVPLGAIDVTTAQVRRTLDRIAAVPPRAGATFDSAL